MWGGGDTIGVSQMTTVDAGRQRVVLAPSDGAVREVRRRLTSQLRACAVAETAIEDAAIVVSELVTNAVRHAARGSEATVQVEWSLEHPQLWLQVTDLAPSSPQQLHDQAPVGGRGLSIVAALAESWSLVQAAEGTTVHACICVA